MSDKTLCCGCRSCELSCPINAITMIEDEEGFYYPQIDENKCENCSICRNACPLINDTVKNSTRLLKPKVYAAKHCNKEILRKSSSGGAFSVIADYVLKKEGIVVGCEFDDELNPRHIIAQNKLEVTGIRGSKYVQSDTKNTYQVVKNSLENNKYVMYSGTPCQIAGLKQFLKKDYDKLVTVDLICHGVPSNWIFHEYLKFIEKKYSGRVTEYKFRDKSKYGWGACGSYKIATNKNRSIKKQIMPETDYYYYYYLKGNIYRECCYTCKYAKVEREGDFSIGDFWNIHKYHNDFYSQEGCSVILVNTVKGDKLFNQIATMMETLESKLEYVVLENPNLKNSSPRYDFRDDIYKRIKEHGFEKIAKEDIKLKYAIPIIKKMAPRSLKKVIKKLLFKY